MSKIFEQLVEVFNKYGWKTGFFLVIATIILTLLKSQFLNALAKKYIDKWIEKIFRKNKENNNKVLFKDSDVLNHEIFNYIDFWLYSSIPTIKFKTEYRTAVFKKYLFIYYKQYRDSLYIFVNDGKYKDMDNATLKSNLYSLFGDIVFNYETKMKNEKLPDVVISKMKLKNNETYTLLLELVNSVCDNHFYDTDKNMLKIFTILNILNATLEYTINVANEVCDNINGELSGKEFDGFIEPVKNNIYLDINDVSNDFVHIYIDSDGILVVKILDDVILDDGNVTNFIHLIRSVNGDVKRLVLIDATSEWNITDKAKKVLSLQDDTQMIVARAIVVRTESQKGVFLNSLKESAPLRIFNSIDDARSWLFTFK